MVSPYAKHLIPQTEAADPAQRPNHGGGYSFVADKWARLDRLLVLGSDAGTYYVNAKRLTLDNFGNVADCLAEDGIRTVSRIVEISEAGRAPKNDAAIFALAIAASLGAAETKLLALGQMPRVCRTGTMLFQFVEALNALRGWGRQARRGVARWYTQKDVKDLAYQLAKYQQRQGWSHRDVLRLSHPKGASAEQHAVLRWALKLERGERCVARGKVDKAHADQVRPVHTYAATADLPALLSAYDELSQTSEVARAVQLITEHRMTHEMVPGKLKAHAPVWDALLEHMPMHALVRNLGQLTAKGVLTSGNARTSEVVAKLGSDEAIKRSRLHPIALLIAQKQYGRGEGDKGKLTWTPAKRIVAALNEAFYKAFGNVQPSGKRTLLALDVSGSMAGGWWAIAGDRSNSTGLSPREISAAMALITMRTEPHCRIMGFSDELIELPISPDMPLPKVIEKISGIPFGMTDCALPFTWGMTQPDTFDVVAVWTDSETNSHSMHPHVALQRYREAKNTDTKLAVCATAATEVSIAQPGNPSMLDCAGFDASVPQVLADFARGV